VTNTERTQATVNPETWAAARVEEIAKGLEQKPRRTKRTPPPKVRGVFFRLCPGGEVKDHLGGPGTGGYGGPTPRDESIGRRRGHDRRQLTSAAGGGLRFVWATTSPRRVETRRD